MDRSRLIFGDEPEKKRKLINPLDDPIRYPLDSKGIGNAFADSFKRELRFVADENCWRHFDGIRWKKDHVGLRSRELAKDYLDFLIEILLVIDKEDENFVALSEVVISLTKYGGRKTMLDESMSVHPLTKSDFDSKKNLLNCQNYTIDLSTGKPRKHDPDDFITKVAPVLYDKDAKSLRWSDFTLEIMNDDIEATRFLQKSCGYGTTGETNQECLFVFFGPTTRNGKGTLVESIVNVLGDYSLNMQPDSLAKRKRYSGSSPSPDIARNVGVRFVCVNEPAEDMVLDAAIVKQLTGSDTITARMLYANSFDYIPQFKLYISTNHLPMVTDDTLFSSGRIKVIPFNRHFGDNEQDRSLKSLFRTDESKSAILNWLLEGLMLYRCEGLEAPQSILEATSAYRKNTDTVGLFIKDATSKNPKAKILKTSDVFGIYTDWCDDNDVTSVNLKNFIYTFRKSGFVKRDGKLGNVVYGVEINYR